MYILHLALKTRKTVLEYKFRFNRPRQHTDMYLTTTTSSHGTCCGTHGGRMPHRARQQLIMSQSYHDHQSIHIAWRSIHSCSTHTGWDQLWLSLKALTKRYTFNTGNSQVRTVWFSLAFRLSRCWHHPLTLTSDLKFQFHVSYGHDP